jgi:hypothetical protein
VELLATALTIWPFFPSNNDIPIWLAEERVVVAGTPAVTCPVAATAFTLYPDGGINKSAELVTDPVGVFKEMRPEPVADGVLIDIDVALADVGFKPLVTFTIKRSLVGVVSKFAPAIVTIAPGATICGVNESMRGFPSELVTVNESELVTDPDGEVTVIVPVVAPLGTATANEVVDAELTTAGVPLKLTVSCAGFALKLDPEILTEVPIGPDLG